MFGFQKDPVKRGSDRFMLGYVGLSNMIFDFCCFTKSPIALTSSSNAHEDELSCHRLAAGGRFGRPARYLVHYI